MIEELDAENTEGDNKNLRGDMHPYIPACANIQTPDKASRLPLDTLAVNSCSRMIGALHNQYGFVDSSCSSVGETRHLWH